MNTTSKTLSEKINDVLSSCASVEAKTIALIKLGITRHEASYIAARWMPTAVAGDFTYTFGVEIETVNCNAITFISNATRRGLQVMNHMHQYSGCHIDRPVFKLVPDGSISGAGAAECVTPALNSTDGFASLEACCASLAEVGATANKSCGLHVHIGAACLNDKQFCNVFVNYMRLETAIETFLAPSRRGRGAQWCASLRNYESSVLNATTKQGMRQALRFDRYHRVNAEAYNRHQTIEFRQHQGTTNYTKISAWVKFLGKLVEYSLNHRLSANVDRIEDIPFLTQEEKAYFIGRRSEFEARYGVYNG